MCLFLSNLLSSKLLPCYFCLKLFILLIKNPRNLQDCEQLFFGLLVNRTDGIGLSAPQVGINVQLMVFNPVGERGEGEEIVLVNPRVNKYSNKMIPYEEGCLSFPGIHADVEVLPNATFFLLLLIYFKC